MAQKPCFYAETVREQSRNSDSTVIPSGNGSETVILRRYRPGMLRKPCFYADTVREQSRNRDSAPIPSGNGPESGYMLGRMRYAPTKHRVSASKPIRNARGARKKGPEWGATKIPGRRGVEALQVRGEGAMSYWLVERALIS